MTRSARDWRIVLLGALALGLVLRLVVLPTPGFPTDVGTFQAWAERLREVGPAGFYAPGYFSDYPPGFLYVLWLVGSALGGMPAIVAKALSIPFDFAIAVTLYLVVRRVTDEGTGVVAATLYILNPALVLAGPYWGQVDAAGTLPVLLALVALGRGRFAASGALAGLAAMVKPQFGLALVVVLAAAAIDLIRNGRWRPLAESAVASVVAVAVLAIPFGLDVGGLVDLVRDAAETYPYSTLYAFNVWALIHDFWLPDDVTFLGVTYQAWSALLFGLAVFGVVGFLWRAAPRQRHWGSLPARDLATALAAGALVVLAFYFLPTRVHERYLFAAFALLAPFAATRWRALSAYAALSAFFLLTVLYAFTRYEITQVGAPDFLEATLYQRPGVMLLASVGLLAAAALAWWWGRAGAGELRPGIVTALDGERAAAEPRSRGVPAWLRLGRRPTRRDLTAALLLAFLMLLTRGYRLDWPRDMYFDEVYHARTAMELLAGREPYEWTHPHLAKELMALSILAFGSVRAVERGGAPAEAVAFAADGTGSRAYALGDGSVWWGDGVDERAIGRFDGTVRALAVDGEWVVVALDRAVVQLRAGTELRMELPESPTAVSYVAGRTLVATASEVLLYDIAEQPPTLRVPIADTVALWMRPPATEFYAASSAGTVRLIDLSDGATRKEWRAAAEVRTMTVEPDASRIFLGDSREPVLHRIDVDGGGIERVRIENARTAPFRGPPIALASSPRSRMVWVLGQDGLGVVDPNGASAFAVVREAAGARSLAVDDRRDRVVAAAGIEPVDVASGRLAFAWRFPGVIAAAILAFFLFLLARRLFATRAVAYVLGLLLLVDGAMFAQARIGMNDVYVGAAIVGGWYFVVAALHPDARRPRLDLALAGGILGLGLAAKWAAGPAILGVGLVSLILTARAFVQGRPGTGGPLDLLAGRGANAFFLAACFVALPLGIYVASYVPWFGLGHGITSAPGGGWSFLELQRQMFTYHSQLTAPHAAGSPWWAWPLNLKPVYWEFAQAGPDTSTYIYDAGNLVTWWAGIPAMAFCSILAWRTRAPQLALPLFAFAVQYAQWIPVSRVLFQYHFFTALPFYLLALAVALTTLWHRPTQPLRSALRLPFGLTISSRGRALAAFVLAAGAVWFVLFYPWLSALPIPSALAGFYFWLPTWQYGCQFYPTFSCT